MWLPPACAVGAAPGAPSVSSSEGSRGANAGNKTSLPLSPAPAGARGSAQPLGRHDSYLVDSASSHMLVSKIKPCKSKFKHLNGETANGSLNQLSYI